jgi:hypothetical protein
MLDKQVFDALAASQEGGQCLARRLKQKPIEDQHEWSDALSDVVLGAYYDADDREDLVTMLRYCVRELQSAVNAVRHLEESHVPNV